MSKNKGLTEDGFSDKFIKDTKNWQLLNNLHNYESLKLLKPIFKSRIVPLNKIYPDIPKQN